MTRPLRVALVVAVVSIVASTAFTVYVLARPTGCRGVVDCGLERRARCEHVAEDNAAVFHLPVDRATVDACTARP